MRSSCSLLLAIVFFTACPHPLPPPAIPQLANVPAGACNASMVLAPAPTEIGQWAAARLVPASYPFVVTEIKYVLYGATGQTGCDPTIGHRVQLYRSTVAAPPATPTVEQEIAVPPSPGASDPRLVDLTLTTPITLNAGESLIVQVEMAGSASAYLCMHMCKEPPTYDDRNYWSGTTAPPFTWSTLTSLGIPWDITMRAIGR